MFYRVESPRLVNIFTASLKDLEPLKKKVCRNGLVRVTIHPFLKEHSQASIEYPRIPGYQKERDKIFQADSEDPLIIGEEARLVRSLPQRIREIAVSPPEQIFIYTTERNRADSIRPGFLYRLQRSLASICISQDHKRQEDWDHLANILRRLGVENVALGGQYLTYFDANSCKDPKISPHLQECLERLAKPGSGKLQIPDETDATALLPVTCVGWTAQNLAYRGFNVSLTLPSSPRKIIKPTAY